MSIVLDIILVLIILFAGWRGYKAGIINGVFGLIALVIAIYAANLVATVYYGEFTGMLKPFACGVVDSSVSSVLSPSQEDLEEGILTVDEKDKSDVYTVSYTAMQNIGLNEGIADELAKETAKQEEHVGQPMSNVLTTKLCEKTAFALIFGLIFVLAVIIFAIIGNIINLKFSLPGLEKVNSIVGALLGALRGFVFVLFFTCMFRYAGVLFPSTVLEGTKIAKGLMDSNMLADLLGM